MGKKPQKKNTLDTFNDVLALLKNSLGALDMQDTVDSFEDITCQSDIVLFSNQIRSCELELATRDIVILSKVSLLKPLVNCSLFAEKKTSASDTKQENETESDTKEDILASRNSLFDYIELLYKTACNNKQYNVYLNLRNKEIDKEEKILKKKMRKEMKKMYPCFKRIVDTVDKEAIKELMEMMKTKKFVDVGQEVAMRLLKNGFDLDEAFKEFDLEKFKDLTDVFTEEESKEKK